MAKQWWCSALLLASLLVLTGGRAARAAEPCSPLSLAPLALPAATEGVPYNQKLRTYGGRSPVNLMLSAGALPAGLTLSPSGVIAGTPREGGTFTVSISAADSCQPQRQTAAQTLQLAVSKAGAVEPPPQPSVIRKAPLKVTVVTTPAVFSVASGEVAERQVSYRLTAQPAETATLNSPGGTFAVAGAVIEALPAPLTATLLNGSGVVTESIVIPPRVMEAARREKAGKIVYSRAFSGRGTTALGLVEFTLAP